MNQAPVVDRQRPQPATNGHAAAGGTAIAVSRPAFVSVQNGWLRRQRGRSVSIRLGSGEVIAGVLIGDDSYTLELRIPGHAETALVFKHSIQYLVPAGDR
jgi:sRNA-binding regulator protein Hfq